MQKCNPPRLRQPQMLHARVEERSPTAPDPAKFHGKLFARIQSLSFLIDSVLLISLASIMKQGLRYVPQGAAGV